MTRAGKIGLIAALFTALVAVAVAGANQFDFQPFATRQKLSPSPTQSAFVAAELPKSEVPIPVPEVSSTVDGHSHTASQTPTVDGHSHTASQTPTVEAPSPRPSQTQTPTKPANPIAPYPGAPLCPDVGEAHDLNRFHTLWDTLRGCHYDHEHGQNPFTPEVEAAFPGFDLRALLGPGAGGVGHTNPSSPMENTHKHGGFKWNVQLAHAEGCAPYEGSTLGVNGSVIHYHGFGDYSVELEGTIHSAAALLRQCHPDNPTDYGYMYVVQHVNYGQRITPYQGTIIPYPNNPVPAYDSARGPYLSMDCVGDVPQCRDSIEFIRNRDLNGFSNWTTKHTGRHDPVEGSLLFQLFFRVRDTYQVIDWNDMEHPFTFQWICSPDGVTYDPQGCEYNNTTTQVHEVAGVIPAEWDNLPGFDNDPEVGRITAEGFVTRFGDLNPACTQPAEDCHPIKLVRAFVGHYGSVLVYTEGKGQNIVPYLPERDVYFCGTQVCAEGDPGAVPSGWVGTHN